VGKNLETKLNALPQVSGIYKFIDKGGGVLYIGKGKNIQKRVKSYFQNKSLNRPRIKQMLPLIANIEVVETNNEIEALVLESALVKKYQPPFNTELKDDKSYAWIYITTKDEFPTVKIVRSFKKGEYCKGKLFGPYPSGYTIKRVYSYLRKLYPFCTCKNKDCSSSLYYHIGLCPGPYVNAISKEDYRKNIENIIKLLSGKKKNHIKNLEKEMEYYSKIQNYEKAAQLRDRVKDLKYISQDIDFTYYDDIKLYESKREKARKRSFKYLGIKLNWPDIKRMECYDISNMQGRNAYGSMVVAIKGKLERSKYRIYKIQGKETPNDYEMLKEVLVRRFKGKEQLPQLVLIDGGKGQLSFVKDTIPSDIMLMGISKGKYLRRRGRMIKDEYWIVEDGKISKIELENPELLIDLRNEAHRFAISYFRRESIRKIKESVIDEIEGVGPKRRKMLIKRFGCIKNIREANYEELYSVIKNRKVVDNIMKNI
jgi:excinuclease ABC subunit C